MLDHESGLETRERLPLIREEQVAALGESLAELAVERERLLRHQAVRARAPLPAHAARLEARRARADPRPLVQGHGAEVALEQVQRD